MQTMRTVLFADDNGHIREYCRRELEDEGYRVILAADGLEAAALALAQRPDLAILDLCMPRANGMETVERLRDAYPDLPVVFFTAHDEDCLRDARNHWAAACVEKSEDLTELKRVVAKLLGSPDVKAAYRTGLPPIAREPDGGAECRQLQTQ
jgi:CheY-like chemotaxis protein